MRICDRDLMKKHELIGGLLVHKLLICLVAIDMMLSLVIDVHRVVVEWVN